MLMLITEFRDKFFTPNSKPTTTTIKNWINNGHIPGKKYGRTYYVVTSDPEVVNKISEPDFSSFEDDK